MPLSQEPHPRRHPPSRRASTARASAEWPAALQPQLHPFVATAVPTDTTLKTRVRYPGHAGNVSEVSGVVNIHKLRLLGACS